MRRLLGPLIVVAGVLLASMFGVSDVRAAELTKIPNMMMVADSKSFEATTSEHVIIITSQDLFSTPLFQSFLSSYAKTNLPLSKTDAIGVNNTDENRAPKPPMGTNEPNTVASGTNSVRAPTERSEVGNAGGVIAPTTLKLSELLPNTSGDDAKDEYIILINTGGQTVDLTGWSLLDASGKTFIFDKGTVAPGTTLKVLRTQSDIALNNDTDTVSLISPDKQLIDSTTYEKAKPDDKFMRDGAIWRFASQISQAQSASATKIPVETNSANQPVAPTVNSEPIMLPTQPEKKERPTKSVPSTTSLEIANAKQKPDDAWVEVTGVATVSPGVLGKQFFYVEDETGAIQVYKHDGIFPDITIGTSLTIRGHLSTNGQERRLKVPKDGSIKVNDGTQTLEPSERKINELSSTQTGSLARTSGVLVSAQSDELEIEQDGQTLTVSLPNSGNIDITLLKVGARMQVTGLVRPSGDKVKLSVRSKQDIVVLEEPTSTTTAGTIESGKTTREQQDQMIAGIIAAASSAALVIWIVRQQIIKRNNLYDANSIAVSAETVH